MDKPRERDIQKTIIEHLRLSGFLVWRNQAGKVKSSLGGWMQLAPEGSPDVYALKGGILYGIECKVPGNQQTPAQADYQRLLIKHGARYYVASCLEDVLDLK